VQGKAPLLVLLHGNDGNTYWMDRIWGAAAELRGVITLVLRCPAAGGFGDPSWWRWHQGKSYDAAWLRARMGEVARELPVDPARVFASGYSGGASFLSAYIREDPALFSAVAFVAGGAPPPPECMSRKTPASFLVGSRDTMLVSHVRPLHDALAQCGHEVKWDERAEVTHEAILWHVERGGAEGIVDWLLGRAGAGGGVDGGL